MTLRVAHISDLHIASPKLNIPEDYVDAFLQYARRSVPPAAMVVFERVLMRPLNRKLLTRFIVVALAAARIPGPIGWAAIGTILVAMMSLAFLFRRQLMTFIVSLRQDVPKRRERLIEDLCSRNIDHIVVSGDFTNAAGEEEFAKAKAFLDALRQAKPKMRITIVPGNHDVQEATKGNPWPRLPLYHKYLGDFILPFLQGGEYPSFQKHDDLHIYGHNSVSLGEGFGTKGALGKRQLKRTALWLKEAGDHPKIVVLHHHLKKRFISAGMPRLGESDELLSLIDPRTTLVLHGHKHEIGHWEPSKDGAKIPIHCAGSTVRFDRWGPTSLKYRIYEYQHGALVDPRPTPVALSLQKGAS